MVSYCIRFSDKLERATNNHVRLAKKIWKDAKADNNIPIRVAAGNYAGYGKYVARCHSTGVIEFPTGNRFSVLELVGNELTFRGSKNEYLGTLLHEIGHHIVNTSTASPWSGNPDGGKSTHLKKEWIWICFTGWSHFHDEVPAPSLFADSLKSGDPDLRKSVVDALTRFNPYTPPPKITVKERACEYCGGSLEGKRRGAKFCSTSCRVMASRSS